ncbi:MAG: hypothetical protein TREMPRED_003705 [Tremellales sp. Tagirdzhanova-0007]|nr:MAG: hypothetical protein TREMPRED_003705 [Tremellales sp. Tagirdzhanova-0007]
MSSTTRNTCDARDEGNKHYLVVTYHAWGHCRPMISLCAGKLLRLNTLLRITILVPGALHSRVKGELARYSLSEDETARLRVVHYGPASAAMVKDEDRGGMIPDAVNAFRDIYRLILKVGGSLTDSITKEIIPSFAPLPAVIITDVVLSPSSSVSVNEVVRQGMSQNRSGKILRFVPVSSATFAWWYLPELSPFPDILREMAKRTAKGGDPDQLYSKLVLENEDIVYVPPCEPMHVYETEPNCPGTNLFLARHYRNDQDKIDGAIVSWPAVMSQPMIAAAERQFGRFYPIGPQLPPPQHDRVDSAAGRHPALSFLDRFEPGTVLYISFGSWYYPPTPAQTTVLVDVLLGLSIPFLITQGLADEESRQTLKEGGDVLEHVAVAAYLGHGGSNSVMESIEAGVPMSQIRTPLTAAFELIPLAVLWPGGHDQPWIANELSLVHNAAIELLEIRQGPCIGLPTVRGPVIQGTEAAIRAEFIEVFTDAVRGGTRINETRQNVISLRDKIRADTREGGLSHRALVKLAWLGWEDNDDDT